MKKLKYLSGKMVAIFLTFALIVPLSACGAASDTAETTAAETSVDYEALSRQVSRDQVRIMLIDPVKPDDIGTVNSLNYKGLEFDAPIEEEITSDDVDDYINELLTVTRIELDEATVQDNDSVNIDYEGTLDGETFDGGSAEDYDLVIGSDTFIDGFEDGLIGAKTGDTVDLDLTFPDDYSNEDLAGQDVVFSVTINSVSRYLDISELTDDGAKQLSDDDTATVESYKQDVEDDLKLAAMRDAKSDLYDNALQAALEASDVETNEDAANWELDLSIINQDNSLKQQGIDLATYLGYYMGTDYVTYRDSLYDQAYEVAREVVVRYAICEAEGLEYDDAGVEAYKDEFQYTDEDLEYLEDVELEQAVMWVLSARVVVENGTVNYVEETTASDDATDSEATASDESSSDDESTVEETATSEDESSEGETAEAETSNAETSEAETTEEETTEADTTEEETTEAETTEEEPTEAETTRTGSTSAGSGD